MGGVREMAGDSAMGDRGCASGGMSPLVAAPPRGKTKHFTQLNTGQLSLDTLLDQGLPMGRQRHCSGRRYGRAAQGRCRARRLRDCPFVRWLNLAPSGGSGAGALERVRRLPKRHVGRRRQDWVSGADGKRGGASASPPCPCFFVCCRPLERRSLPAGSCQSQFPHHDALSRPAGTVK